MSEWQVILFNGRKFTVNGVLKMQKFDYFRSFFIKKEEFVVKTTVIIFELAVFVGI